MQVELISSNPTSTFENLQDGELFIFEGVPWIRIKYLDNDNNENNAMSLDGAGTYISFDESKTVRPILSIAATY